jgi:hypothetical protein
MRGISTTLLAVVLSVVQGSFAATFFNFCFGFCKFDFRAIPVVVVVVVLVVLELHFVPFDHLALVNQQFLERPHSPSSPLSFSRKQVMSNRV